MAYKAFNAVASAVTGAVEKVEGPPHWQTDLFACMDDTNICLQTWCCVWCTESHIITMRETGTGKLEPFQCCGAFCCDVATRGCFSLALASALRRELVHRYGIKNEPYCDTVMRGCCGPCTLCQVQREMGMRKEHCGGFLAKGPEGSVASEAMSKVSSAVNKVGGAAGAGFSSGLFEFAGITDLVDSWCCGPCTMAHMANRLDAGRVDTIAADVENKCEPVTFCGAWCCYPGFALGLRRELVTRYGYPEPILHSFCFTAFCPCCNIGQLRREMSKQGHWPGGMLVKEAIQLA